MQTAPNIVDIYHGDIPSGSEDIESFHAWKEAGVQGIVLKVGQGNHNTDPKFEDWYTRCVTVWGEGNVAAYYMLDGSGNHQVQTSHFWDLTKDLNLGLTNPHGKKFNGRILDYELPSVDLATAVACCHELASLQNEFPGMYGSDRGELGQALTGGHFAPVCWLWIARYGKAPLHPCDLWQYAAGESGGASIDGHSYDASVWMNR